MADDVDVQDNTADPIVITIGGVAMTQKDFDAYIIRTDALLAEERKRNLTTAHHERRLEAASDEFEAERDARWDEFVGSDEIKDGFEELEKEALQEILDEFRASIGSRWNSYLRSSEIFDLWRKFEAEAWKARVRSIPRVVHNDR
jgi:hypothetical protein